MIALSWLFFPYFTDHEIVPCSIWLLTISLSISTMQNLRSHYRRPPVCSHKIVPNTTVNIQYKLCSYIAGRLATPLVMITSLLMSTGNTPHRNNALGTTNVTHNQSTRHKKHIYSPLNALCSHAYFYLLISIVVKLIEKHYFYRLLVTFHCNIMI